MADKTIAELAVTATTSLGEDWNEVEQGGQTMKMSKDIMFADTEAEIAALEALVTQDVKPTASPTFADLLITGLGAMKAHFTNWIAWLSQSLNTTDSPTFAGLTADSHVVEEELTELNALIVPPTKAGCQLEINGEGLPQFPDGVSVYDQDNWVDTDSWTFTRFTDTYEDGCIIVTATDANPAISSSPSTRGFEDNMIIVRLEKTDSDATKYAISDGTTVTSYDWGSKNVIYLVGYIKTGDTNLVIYPGYIGSLSGDTFKICRMYIGDGTAYTGLADKSGSQNPGTTIGVVPYDNEDGKTIFYNGNNSQIEFDNPIFNTLGTIRLWGLDDIINDTGTTQFLFDTRSPLNDGGIFVDMNSSEVIILGLLSSGGVLQEALIGSKSNKITLVFGASSVLVYNDGYYSTTVTYNNPLAIGSGNMLFGTYRSKDALWCHGAFGFRYTVEQMSSKEVLSDANNQIKSNNTPMSQTATANTINMHDENGHTLMEFATKTATSTGNQGAIAMDATNLYVCIADASWKKITLETI